MAIKITGLYIYIIKSCAPMSVRTAGVEPSGLFCDRRFMLVDKNGVFLSQNVHPKMATIQPKLVDGSFIVSARGIGDLQLPFFPSMAPESVGPVRQVEVHGMKFEAREVNGDSAGWFSQYLGKPCSLVFLGESRRRTVSEIQGEMQLNCHDSSPVHLINEASLATLKGNVPANRFRPNIVVEGADPFEEEQWLAIHSGSIMFRARKLTERCAKIDVDQRLGIRVAQNSPLAQLSKRGDSKANKFGIYLVPCTRGNIDVGAELFGEKEGHVSGLQ